MADYLIQDSTLTGIADAIRAKTGSSAAMTPAQMVTAIGNIPSGGGITPTGTKQISITQNGTTTEDVTQYANAEIMVNVPSGASLPSVISKIDGGSFTFAADAAIQSNKINHSLGIKPKGYIIWSESVMMDDEAYANQTLMFSYGIGFSWKNAGTTHGVGYSYAMWRRTNGAVSENSADSPTITDTQIAPVGFYYWRGGVQYNWLAWA